MNLLIFLLPLSLLTRGTFSSSESSIRVEDFGYRIGDSMSTVLVFYIEVFNDGHAPVEVEVRNEECCLRVDVDDLECRAMRLPTKSSTVDPVGSRESTKKFEFIFHSLYVMNRKGVCTFQVLDRLHAHRERVRIAFETLMPNSATCSSVDLDPERECQPANCVLKYMGRRNFFNKNTLLCESVAECMTLSPDRTEIIAFYNSETNSCVQLDEGIESMETAEEEDSTFQDELMEEH